MPPDPDDRIFCRYAVAFEVEGAPAAGALAVGEEGVRLSGRRRGEWFELSIPREDLAGVHIGRSSGERLNGYKTVVLERRDRPDVLVAPFGFGFLHEIADLLGSINAQPSRPSERLELIVPIRRGSLLRVRQLISTGPPFAPKQLGLRRHEVYLVDDQVRFVFEGYGVRDALQHLVGDVAVWRAGLSWRQHIAGRPQLGDETRDETPRGELLYSWRC
jgi:hypothetical protein